MTKDQLISRILKFDTPHDVRLLRQFSEERLREYLLYLEKSQGRRRKPEAVTAS
jgi:hypothetical protein